MRDGFARTGENAVMNRPAYLPDVLWLRELKPGETWTVHPAGGVIVAHPERPPVWCYRSGGVVVEEAIEPAWLPQPRQT